MAQDLSTTHSRPTAPKPATEQMSPAKKIMLVGAALFLLSGIFDARGGLPFIGHSGCAAEPVTAENMFDPTMPWLPDPQTCPEFYEGRAGVTTGPPPQSGTGAPAIDPSDASEFAEWGGPWYMEGPSCWATTDC